MLCFQLCGVKGNLRFHTGGSFLERDILSSSVPGASPEPKQGVLLAFKTQERNRCFLNGKVQTKSAPGEVVGDASPVPQPGQ